MKATQVIRSTIRGTVATTARSQPTTGMRIYNMRPQLIVLISGTTTAQA